MNKRILSVLVFALVVSAVASFVLYKLISTTLAKNAQPSSYKMLVASRNLPIGTLIREPDMTEVDGTGKLPPGALINAKDVVGRGVTADIFAGEPILEGRLAALGAGAGLAATIPSGMRAVAIRVNEVVGVAGFVSPGQHVDILIAGNPPGPSGASTGVQSKTLLQNISVLSAGQNIQKDPEGKPVTVQVVNLLVNPEQAEILSLASNEARIQLILRNPLDTQVAHPPGTTIANLFSGVRTGIPSGDGPKPAPAFAAPRRVPAPKVAPTPPPPEVQRIIVPITVEVYTGSRRADSKFAPKEEKP